MGGKRREDEMKREEEEKKREIQPDNRPTDQSINRLKRYTIKGKVAKRRWKDLVKAAYKKN